MYTDRKQFFLQDNEVYGEKNEKVIYKKYYRPKQIESINQRYAHNVYYFPNWSEVLSKDQLVSIKKNESIRNEIVIPFYTSKREKPNTLFFNLWLWKPTYIATWWDRSEAHWVFERPIAEDLSHLVWYLSSIALKRDVKRVSHQEAFKLPGTYCWKEKQKWKIYWNDGKVLTEFYNKSPIYIDNKVIEKTYNRHLAMISSIKKNSKVFKDVFDVSLASLQTEDVISAIPWSSGIIIDKHFYSYPNKEHSLYWLPKDIISQYMSGMPDMIDTFLSENFWFTIFGEVSSYNSYTYNDIVLRTSEAWVHIGKEAKDWSVKYKLVIMWDTRFIWYGTTTKSIRWWDNDYESKVYMIKHNDEEKVIYPDTRASTFNASHARSNISFLWSDNDLMIMFHILDIMIKDKYEYIDESWMTNDYIAIGNYIQYKNGSKKYIPAHHLPDYIDKTLNDVSVEQFILKARELWKWEKIPLFFLGMIALSWMDFWKRNWYSIMPFILINWSTGAGKSELIECAMSFIWYRKTNNKWEQSRIFMVNDLSNQPISTIWTDAAVLILDEFTRVTNPRIENIVRNIINWWRWSRWHIGGNVYYNYRSPILLWWEDMPVSDSVVNRAMFLDISVDDRTGVDDAIRKLVSIKRHTCIKEILDFYMKIDPSEIRQEYEIAKAELVSEWLSQRESDAWAYALMMLHYFPVTSKKDAINYIQIHVNETRRDDKYASNFEAIKDIINQAIIARQARIIVMQDSTTETTTLRASLAEDYYKQKVSSIKKYAMGAESEWYDVVVSRNTIDLIAYEETWFNQESAIESVIGKWSEQFQDISAYISMLQESWSARTIIT